MWKSCETLEGSWTGFGFYLVSKLVLNTDHSHLSYINWLMLCTAYLVCVISTVNGCSKRKKPCKTGASSGHITNLKQSIFLVQYLWHRPIYRPVVLKQCLHCGKNPSKLGIFLMSTIFCSLKPTRSKQSSPYNILGQKKKLKKISVISECYFIRPRTMNRYNIIQAWMCFAFLKTLCLYVCVLITLCW